MKKATILVLLVAVACQTKKETPRKEVDPSQLVSRMEDPQPVPPAQPTPAQPPAEQPAPQALPRPGPPPLPDPLPGTRKVVSAIVGSAWRAAIGDVDRDGNREVVIADSKEIRVLDAAGKVLASAPVAGGIHKLVVSDIDGDGRAEIFTGWGQTRDHMNTKARLTLHRIERGKLVEEIVMAPDTTRNEIVSIVPMPEQKAVVFAYFDSKYNVTSVVAKRGASGWETQKIASLRTANSYARGDVDGNGTIDLVVGRVYGDDKGIDGDAFVLAPDGTRTRIPSTRGMRSIAVFDGDGDGRVDVFMGDGWHQNYGDNARGLLTWARYQNGAFKTELIEDTQGQYAIENILRASIDGQPAVVAVGSHYVRVFTRASGTWRGLTIGGLARDVAVGDLDGKPGDEILLVGERSEIVSLRAADWK